MTHDEPSSRPQAVSPRDISPRDLSHSELLRAAKNLEARLEAQNDDLEDDEAALRWRHALLRLSETFLDAAAERHDLSPILLGALHNALEQLLIHGEEADLMALEEWLSHEAPGDSSSEDSGSAARSTPEQTPSTPEADIPVAPVDRRSSQRRGLDDRRQSA